MAWEQVEWACGHTGAMQLYGKQSQRDWRIAQEAGKKCFVCWLIGKWEEEKDPRWKREDRYQLAKKIANGKGIRINGLPETSSIPLDDSDKENPLSKFSTEELLAELQRRHH
jgi:hypothetical protein